MQHLITIVAEDKNKALKIIEHLERYERVKWIGTKEPVTREGYQTTLSILTDKKYPTMITVERDGQYLYVGEVQNRSINTILTGEIENNDIILDLYLSWEAWAIAVRNLSKEREHA